MVLNYESTYQKNNTLHCWLYYSQYDCDFAILYSSATRSAYTIDKTNVAFDNFWFHGLVHLAVFKKE